MSIKLFFILFLIAFSAAAQQGDGGIPNSYKLIGDTKSLDKISFEQPDISLLRAEDLLTDEAGSAPWRFGFNNYCAVSLSNSGTWTVLPNGNKIWRLLVHCEKALTVNLTFKNVSIPEGNELFVYNPDKSFVLGKFTAYHTYDGQLGTELVPGEDAIIEYFIPFNNPVGNIELGIVTHGYRQSAEFQEKAFGSSGGCNINANCPQGNPWNLEKKGAMMLVSGSNGFCSGALVNNVLNDGKPYVLTANHCYSNPASWIFRFQWEAPGCTNPASSPSFQSLNGAVLRARASESDFCLVEITGGLQGGTVPSVLTPYFCGWDRSGAIPSSCVGIHHPSGDIKKISFENDPLISTTFGGAPANSHWGITSWDEGVTEPGSSGSPIFDQNHRIVGQLHGGASACGASALSDEYGKFSYSWNPVSSDSSTQLKYWLDPSNSGAQFINGYDPSGGVAVQVDPSIGDLNGASGVFCGADVTVTFTLSNSGAVPLNSATINYGFDGNNNLSYNWIGTLTQWQSTTITLPTASLSNGNHTFSASVSNPNTGVDENLLNNAVNSSFVVVIDGQSVVMDLTLDCYGSETSWELLNASGTVLFSGNGYQDNAAGLVSESWCLGYGCYTYEINDSYGDGIAGIPWCQASGQLEISYLGDSLTGISIDSSDFGDQAILNFCISENGLDINSHDNIQLYPNPSSDILFINSAQPLQELKVYDVSGKIWMTFKQTNSTQALNVGALSAGYYWLVATAQNGQLYRKEFIKR